MREQEKYSHNPSIPKELYGIAIEKTTEKSILENFSYLCSFPLKGAPYA